MTTFLSKRLNDDYNKTQRLTDHILKMKTESIKIVIDTQKPLNTDERNIISSLEREFKNNGFLFEIENSTINFYLKSLDVERFKNKLNSLVAQNRQKVSEEIFSNLIKGIENIRSYGIKSGKRIFFDYNKERKVEGRSRKVERRGFHYYTKNNKFTKEVNEIPREFENTIVCDDSEATLKKLPSNCIDLIITSPPIISDWDMIHQKMVSIGRDILKNYLPFSMSASES